MLAVGPSRTGVDTTTFFTPAGKLGREFRFGLERAGAIDDDVHIIERQVRNPALGVDRKPRVADRDPSLVVGEPGVPSPMDRVEFQ